MENTEKLYNTTFECMNCDCVFTITLHNNYEKFISDNAGFCPYCGDFGIGIKEGE